MRYFLFIFFIAFILIILETTLLSSYRFNDIKLSLVFPYIVWFSFKKEIDNGFLYIIAISFLTEIFTIMHSFVYMLSFSISYLLIRYILNNINCIFIWQNMLIMAFVTLINNFILYLFYGILERVIPYALIQAILNAILTPIYFLIFDTVDKFFFPKTNEINSE